MRGWWMAAILLLSVRPAAAAIDAVNVYEPRTFGYFIGDTLERDVEVITSGNTELFTAALPRPGALTYWLDLIAIDHSEREENGRKIYDIKLKYQIFYSAIEATGLNIPALPLKFKNPNSVASDATASDEPADPAAKYSASIPALALTIAPLRNLVLTDLMPDKTKELSDILRPDAPAHELATAPKESVLAISGVSLLICGLLLLWHYAIWPFKKRTGRPFTQADRQIRDLLSYGMGDPTYREALLILHRAFDEAAGRRLFAEDATRFTEEHRRFAGLSSRLKIFFDSSRLYFFSDDRRAAEEHFPIENVRKLAGDLAREERAAA
ncbi:nonribosomal peptide synthetase MxaA [Hyphomicrobium sp.]|jgi:mxaA protein|uniref:nonribosomal peptide synthetase MxaA n=1 Tax=Hyphomicrobium sp. TaxID=82 RepID=UPI0035630EC3